MTDFSDYKVPVFPGINDNPVEPTENKAGNGSDLIARFNNFLDDIAFKLNQINNFAWKLEIVYTTNISQLDIFYLDVPESVFRNDPSFSTPTPTLISSLAVGTDFDLGTDFDFTFLLEQRNCGAYAFCYKDTDGNYVPMTTLTYVPYELNGLAYIDENHRNINIEDPNGNFTVSTTMLYVVFPARNTKFRLFNGTATF